MDLEFECRLAFWDLMLAHSCGFNPEQPNAILLNGCEWCAKNDSFCSIREGIKGIVIAAQTMKVKPCFADGCLRCTARIDNLCILIGKKGGLTNLGKKRRIMSLMKAIFAKFDDCPHNRGRLDQCLITDDVILIRRAYEEEMMKIRIPQILRKVFSIYLEIVNHYYTIAERRRLIRCAMRILAEMMKMMKSFSYINEEIMKHILSCMATFRLLDTLVGVQDLE